MRGMGLLSAVRAILSLFFSQSLPYFSLLSITHTARIGGLYPGRQPGHAVHAESDECCVGRGKAKACVLLAVRCHPAVDSPPSHLFSPFTQLLLAYGSPSGGNCLTVEGLEALYADGLGDLAADWATLALPEEAPHLAAAMKLAAAGAAGADATISSPPRVVVNVSAGLEGPPPPVQAEAEEEASATPARHHHQAAAPSSTPVRPTASAGSPPSPSYMAGKALVFTPVGVAGGGDDTPTSWRGQQEEGQEAAAAAAPPLTQAQQPHFGVCDEGTDAVTPSPPPLPTARPPIPTMDDLEVAFREWKALVGVDATPEPCQRPVLLQRPAFTDLQAVLEEEEEEGGSGVPPSPTPPSPAALDFLRLGRLLSQRGDHAASGAAAALGLSAIKAARPAEREEVPGADSDPLASCAPDALLRLGNAVYELGEIAAAEAAYAAGLSGAGEAVGAPPDGGGTPVAAAPPLRSSQAWVRRVLVPHSRRAARPFALPLISRLRLNLGMSLEVQGDLEGARDQYAAAAAGAPGHPHALKLLGSVRYALGALAPALAALNAALVAAPAYADAHSDRGMVLCALGRAAEAVPAFEAALGADPSHGPACLNLANVRQARGEWVEAVAGYEAVLAAQPGHWKARLGLCMSLIGGGRLGEAETALEAALAAGAPTGEVEAELDRLKRLAVRKT